MTQPRQISRWAVGGMLALAAGCAQPPVEQQIVNDAAASLGGAARIQAVRTLAQEGSGLNYYLGQDIRPAASGMTFAVDPYKRVIDLSAARARVEQTRTPNFTYFQGQAPQTQVFGLDGTLGYNVNARGNASRIGDVAAKERWVEFHHHPLTLLRAALSSGAALSAGRVDGSGRRVTVTVDGEPFDLIVDASGLPIRIESKSAHPNLGDVLLSTLFEDYRDVDGLRLPHRVSSRIDDFTTADFRFSRQSLDAESGELSAPEALRSAASPVPPAPTVVIEDVAPGVWRLAGQSHHSAVVEFSDHLVLFDAPQSEARALAVIARARELRPDKPLRTIVTTHHHFDHTAGIRAAIAEGLTIVTHAGNRAFFEEMARRPHTLNPDALARRPVEPTIVTVDDEMTMEDSSMKVMLYHVRGHLHSETLLMAYLPEQRILIEVDTFIPNVESNPYIVQSAQTVLENVKRHGLRIERVVPLHFTIEPFSVLERAAAPPS
jgi:glyoxylase-like metal-dependent hydrolase (beta-lactamase superfamily II)